MMLTSKGDRWFQSLEVRSISYNLQESKLLVGVLSIAGVPSNSVSFFSSCILVLDLIMNLEISLSGSLFFLETIYL